MPPPPSIADDGAVDRTRLRSQANDPGSRELLARLQELVQAGLRKYSAGSLKPSQVLGGTILIGSVLDARDLPLLGSLGVTHIVHCAGGSYAQAMHRMYDSTPVQKTFVMGPTEPDGTDCFDGEQFTQVRFAAAVLLVRAPRFLTTLKSPTSPSALRPV